MVSSKEQSQSCRCLVVGVLLFLREPWLATLTMLACPAFGGRRTDLYLDGQVALQIATAGRVCDELIAPRQSVRCSPNQSVCTRKTGTPRFNEMSKRLQAGNAGRDEGLGDSIRPGWIF